MWFSDPPKPNWSFSMDCKIVTNSDINLGGRTVSECAPTDVRAKPRSNILESTFIPYRDKLCSKIKFSSLSNAWSDFSNFFELQIEHFGLASIFKCGIMCFKKCQLAKKLEIISRTNFLEPCSASIWLTNTPCHNPPNRSDKFFYLDWKKSLIFSHVQKALISTLVGLLDFVLIFPDFFQHLQKKKWSAEQVSLRVWLRARLILYELGFHK